MSIGPLGVRDAATLGGFIEIGPNLYALSAYHPFEDGRASGENRVSHPAGPDLEINRFQDPAAKSYTIGAVSKFAPPGKLRPSLTFRGMGIEARYSKVELDYCAIGPVPEGKNVVAIPAFSMAQNVTVEAETDVRATLKYIALLGRVGILWLSPPMSLVCKELMASFGANGQFDNIRRRHALGVTALLTTGRRRSNG